MNIRNATIAAIIGLISPAAIAQDFQPYSESLNDSARQVRERVLRDKTVNRYRGTPSRHTVSAKTRRTCANRGQAAAQYGRSHPDIRRLYALCAGAGL